MAVSTISSKGQITLPSKFRKELGLKPNDRVSIEASGNSIVIRKAVDLLDLAGFLGPALPPEVEREGMIREAVRRGLGKPS